MQFYRRVGLYVLDIRGLSIRKDLTVNLAKHIVSIPLDIGLCGVITCHYLVFKVDNSGSIADMVHNQLPQANLEGVTMALNCFENSNG